MTQKKKKMVVYKNKPKLKVSDFLLDSVNLIE